MNCRVAAAFAFFGLAPAYALAADELVPPAYSPPLWFGEVEINGGKSDLGGNELGSDEASHFWFRGGAVRLGLNFSNGWLIQGDLFAEGTSAASFGDSYDTGIGAAAHLALRNEVGLIGGFAGKLHTDQDNDSGDKSERWFAGVEGQYFLPAATAYGQLGWLDGDGGNDDSGLDSLRETWFARGVTRWFATDDLRIDFSGAWFDGIMDSDVDGVHGYNWSLGVEQRLGATGWSLYGGYEHGYYFQDIENDTITEQTWKFALKYRFGGPASLKDADRHGASLDTPSLLRWVAQTGGPLE